MIPKLRKKGTIKKDIRSRVEDMGWVRTWALEWEDMTCCPLTVTMTLSCGEGFGGMRWGLAWVLMHFCH